MRVEGAVAWRRVDIETIDVRDATGSLRAIYDVTGAIEPELPTRTAVLSGTVNGWLDLDLASPVQPFIGAGAGVARVSSDNSSDTVFVWQVGVGIGYQLGPAVTLQAGYRYFRTAQGRFRADTTQDGLRFRTSGKAGIDAPPVRHRRAVRVLRNEGMRPGRERRLLGVDLRRIRDRSRMTEGGVVARRRVARNGGVSRQSQTHRRDGFLHDSFRGPFDFEVSEMGASARHARAGVSEQAGAPRLASATGTMR